MVKWKSLRSRWASRTYPTIPRNGELVVLVHPCVSDSRNTDDRVRFDIVWTIPFPYDNVTEIWSEKCPGLDDDYEPLRIQY